MIPESIDLLQRQSLINQFKVLSILAEDSDKPSYERKIEILEKGYTGLYPRVFENIYEEFPLEVYTEIETILKMYKRINESVRNLNIDERDLLDLASLEFEGFNQDNGMHYHMMSYLVEKMGEHEDYLGRDLKAHGSTSLKKYHKMLKVYAAYDEMNSDFFSTLDLQKFIDAVKDLD